MPYGVGKLAGAGKMKGMGGKANVKAENSNALIRKRPAGKLGSVQSFKERGKGAGALRSN